MKKTYKELEDEVISLRKAITTLMDMLEDKYTSGYDPEAIIDGVFEEIEVETAEED